MKTVSRFAIALVTVSALVIAGANPALADSKSKPAKDKSISKVAKKATKKDATKKATVKKKTLKKKAVAKKGKAIGKAGKANRSAKMAPRKLTVDPSAPTIDSLSVDSGMPGDEVTLYGANLLDYASVDFGGVVADVVYSLDDASITAVIPDGALSGPIKVTLNNDLTALSKDFTIISTVDPYPTDEPTVDPYPTDEPTVDPYPTDEPTVDPYPTPYPWPTDEPTVEPSPTDEPSPSDAWAVYNATVLQASIDYSNAVQAAQDQFDASTQDAREARDAAFLAATSFNDYYQALKQYRIAVAVQKAALNADLEDAQNAYQMVLSKAYKDLIAANAGSWWFGGGCLDRDDDNYQDDSGYKYKKKYKRAPTKILIGYPPR